MPRGALPRKSGEPRVVARLVERHTGIEGVAHRKLRHHGGAAADVVAVRVADDEELDRNRPLPP